MNGRTAPPKIEEIIAVDESDNIVAYRPASLCHDGSGILHRAFSIFIFNEEGQLLLQRRSENKRLWPLFWSNSCCGHPRKGETNESAPHRRLKEELGISAPLMFVFKFQYHARFGEIGTESEICSVYTGRTRDPVMADPMEISEWKYIGISAFEKKLAEHPEEFTPWSKMEWERLRNLVEIHCDT